MKKEKLLTSGKAAKLCQVSVPSVLNWINLGLLPSFKTAGGHNRISPLSLLRFLSSRNMFIPDELYELAGITEDKFNKISGIERPVALVADDDEAICLLLRELLESIGFLVVDVQSGLESCIQMGLLRPHLLMLDILMPGMNGIQVLQTIRQQPELQKTKIVVISGALDEGLYQELQQIGVKHILQKPLPVSEILRLAKESLAPQGAA
ncbi:MAG: response regulator [Planctomycetota bacterium]